MNKNNNILFILHYPPPVHGAAVVGQQIIDSKLINNTFKCRYINLSTSKNVGEIGSGGFIKLWRFFTINIRVLYALLFFNPKLVYITLTAKGGGFYKDSFIVFLVKLFRKKIVFHFHNKGVALNQNNRKDNWLYKRVFNNTKSILLSKYLYYDIERYVKEDDVYYCPNGISNRNIKFDKQQNNTPPNLLFLSNLIETKGVYVLLYACKILIEKGVEFTCNIVGGEGDISVFELENKIHNINLQNKVFYLGKKYGDEKDKIFKQSDIFIHPTFNDCFPLVILEAMQYRLPVISTSEGAIPEIIEDGFNGFIVEKKDAMQLAEKIEFLINNTHVRYQMGQNGYKRFKENYTIEKFEQNFVKILEQILQE